MKKAKLKKQVTEKDKTKVQEKFNIKTKIITAILMLALLVGFYFLTVKILDNRKPDTSDIEDNVDVRKSNDIDYSDVENMVASSYYLLLNKADDSSNDEYDAYINSLKMIGYPIEFYYIDLSKDVNKEVLSDKEQIKNLKDLKVKDTTLIYIEDGKIKDTYVGSSKIIEYLSSFFTTEDSNETSNETSTSNKENSNKQEENKSNSNSK